MMGATRAALAELPGWPRLLSADQSAAYCGVSKNSFLRRVENGQYPAGIRDGGRVLWDRLQLDVSVDRLMGVARPVDNEDDLNHDEEARIMRELRLG